jgi:hypothetical protein
MKGEGLMLVFEKKGEKVIKRRWVEVSGEILTE